jgi:hypothetical protein
VASAVNGQCLFLRRAHTSVNGGFEWSIEKLVWLPTSKILEEVLCIDHEVRPCRCVRRLSLLVGARIAAVRCRASRRYSSEGLRLSGC